MARSQTYQEHGGTTVSEKARTLGVRATGVDGVMLSYSELPKDKITEAHRQHFSAAWNILWDAVEDYSTQIEELESREVRSTYREGKAMNEFNRALNSASRLELPESVLRDISFDFITRALNTEIDIPLSSRQAISKMGLAVGGDALLADKVRLIAEHHLGALKHAQKAPLNEPQTHAIITAEEMLGSYGVGVDIIGIPSVRDDVTEFTNKIVETAKNKAGKAAMMGTAGLLSAAVLLPTAANAAEVPNASSQSVSVTNESTTSVDTVGSFGTGAQSTAVDKANVSVALPNEKSAEVSTVSTLTSPAETTVSEVSVTVGIGDSLDQSATSISTLTEPSANEMTAPILVGLDVDAKADKAQMISTSTITPRTTVKTMGLGIPETNVEVVEVSTNSKELKPKLDPLTASPEELAIEAIYEYIEDDGNTYGASSLILDSFGNKGKKVTNGRLVENISGFQDSFDSLIRGGGHKDVTYVNNGLMTLSVFEAAANDQSVLDSEHVQAMIAHVKRPDDAYMGRLFDQYASKANEALAANDGALLKGFSEAYKAQLATMYTYVLLANVTDTQQAAEIQAMKDADAAEAARKAAEEAAKIGMGDIEIVAADPNKLTVAAIDRAASAFGWPDAKRIFVREFVLAGSSLAGAAGAAGNAAVESGFDPGIEERTNRAQKGFGFFQWTFGRRDALQAAADALGVSIADATFQAKYAIQESAGRTERDGSGNEWQGLASMTDPGEAADFWRWNFERPDEHVSGADMRVRSAIEIFDQVNGQAEAIKRDAADAAAARIAAEEERKKHMVFNEADMWKNSTEYECPPGINKIGNGEAYVEGHPVEIGLCEIPSTYDWGTGKPGLVNVRAAALAEAMFSQMAKDLGLEKITLNDSFRTMEQQEQAKRDAGDGAADPGWSKHQSGYAFDINMGEANGGDPNVSYYMDQDATYPGNRAWEWLVANAEKFHFKQYKREGWHWSIDGN